MEYIYSAMLLHSAGKKITEENVKKVLTAAGVKADDARIKALTASLEGADIEKAIKKTTAPITPGPAQPAVSEEKEKKEEKDKKKEKKEEEEVSEEEAAAGLGALFG